MVISIALTIIAICMIAIVVFIGSFVMRLQRTLIEVDLLLRHVNKIVLDTRNLKYTLTSGIVGRIYSLVKIFNRRREVK